MIKKSIQAGFTAVELLITLFIAAIFLIAGYQLYTQVTREGAYAEKASRMSNVVYDKLRTEAIDRTGSGNCSTSAPTNEPKTVNGLSSVTLNTTITCPFGTSTTVSLLTITGTYSDGISTKTVVHALYIK